MNTNQGVSVTYQEFLNELENEFKYLQNGGTSYRVETAELSLMVAKKVKDVSLFIDRETAFKTALALFPHVDNERLLDVAKILNVVLGDLHLKATLPENVKIELLRRKRKRRPLKLVPMS